MSQQNCVCCRQSKPNLIKCNPCNLIFCRECQIKELHTRDFKCSNCHKVKCKTYLQTHGEYLGMCWQCKMIILLGFIQDNKNPSG